MPERARARTEADRMKILMERGEPFLIPGGETGCLLIHGFPGAPEEMRWLGNHLGRQGFTALGIRLFGHATHPKDLIRARKQDWMADVEDGYHILRGACERVILVGLSLGGALALTMASRLPVAGVVAMAAPYRLPSLAERLRPILPALSLVWRYRVPTEPSDWQDKKAEALNVHYPVQPVRAIAEVHDLIACMRASLPKIQAPALLIYSKVDGAVPFEQGNIILEQIGSERKELVLLEHSGHNLPRDAEREQVFNLVAGFARHVEEGTA